MSGVEETAAKFVRDEAGEFDGLRRFRTFGPEGPMYEVLQVHADHVRIHLFNSDEQADYRLDRALNDPIAN